MPPIYPITIANQRDLDLIYEGIHQVYRGENISAERIQRDLLKLEKEFREFMAELSTDSDGNAEISEANRKILQSIKIEIKRKRLVKTEIEKKILDLHALLVRLSDPRPTNLQIEEFEDRKRGKVTISDFIKGLEREQEGVL